MSDVGKVIGVRLRELRRASGLSVRQICERGGLFKANVYRAERGDHSPHLETVVRYARALGISVASLVEVLDDPDDRTRLREAVLGRIVEWSAAGPCRDFAIEHQVHTSGRWTGHLCDAENGYTEDGESVEPFDQQHLEADTLDELLVEFLAAIDEMELELARKDGAL